MKTRLFRIRSNSIDCAIAGALLISSPLLSAQLLYQEGFNTDGEAASPQRYTTEGRDALEPAEHGLPDQLGPIYWAHNFEVSYVGVPAPTAGRRMLLAWDNTIDASIVTEDTWKLLEASIKWMVNNKAGATIVVTPDPSALGALGDRLTTAGYNLIADDPGVSEANLPTTGDLLIHAPGNSNSSRGATAKMPVVVMVAADHDDMLTSSIGATATFQPASGTIVTPTHPAAGGLTGSFQVTTGPATWELIGDILPGNAIRIADFVQSIPPTVSSLADVDAMAAGTKQSTITTETVATLDFSDNSTGDWQTDNAIPGGVSGIYGMRIKGKLNVTVGGTYSFALGTDDGGRLQIDLNRNGTYEANETIITDVGPHGHQVMYGNAALTSSATYDFQVIGYNSGGGGDLEVSVANTPGGGQTDLTTLPEAWSNLGDPFAISTVTLQGDATVDVYVAAGDPVEQTIPFIVLLNGPNDNPPGSVFGGGPFTGFEGSGFFGMAGGNKFPFPDGRTDRTLTLAPINVTGKTDLYLSVALAATFLDFETGDYLDIVVYPNGKPGTEVRLARYSAPTASAKYFVDVQNGNTNQLGLEFKNATYKIPAGATSLVVEFRALSTWWNEILAFDDVRITQGAPVVTQPPKLTAVREGNMLRLTIAEGTPPFLIQGSLVLPATWSDLLTTATRSVKIPMVADTSFLRVVNQTDQNVQMFVGTLNGANERPDPVVTPATGSGFISINMVSKAATALVSYKDLKQAATMAHIHGPADANTATGVLVTLNPLTPLATSGLFAASATLTDTQFIPITTGLSYFNVHSGAHTGGEIRGQITPLQQ
jgi:hypothetical protein